MRCHLYCWDISITVFYGIEPNTLDVTRVSLTRGGTLTQWGRGGHTHRHYVIPPRCALDEIHIVYSLTHIIEIPTRLEHEQAFKDRIAGLRETAKRLREKQEAHQVSLTEQTDLDAD